MDKPIKIIDALIRSNSKPVSYPKNLFPANCITHDNIGAKTHINATHLGLTFLLEKIPKTKSPNIGPYV